MSSSFSIILFGPLCDGYFGLGKILGNIRFDIQYRCAIYGVQTLYRKDIALSFQQLTVVRPIGLGRTGLLVAKTPVKGIEKSRRGWTLRI